MRLFGRRMRSVAGAAILGLGAFVPVGEVVEAAEPIAFGVIDCNLPGDQYMLADGKANPRDWTVEALDAGGNVVKTLTAQDSNPERPTWVYRTYSVATGTYASVRFTSATATAEVTPVAEDCTDTSVELKTGDPGKGLVSIQPVRLRDTREAMAVPAGGKIEVKAAGFGAVPSDASAVLLNVAAVKPKGVGHLRVFPCGSAMPKTSTLNYVEGEPRAASTFVKPGTNGTVCIYTSTATHIIVDAQGYVAAKSALTAIAPIRVADSRPGAPVDGPGLLPRMRVDGRISLDMTKLAEFSDVPADAEGYVFNLTTANAAAVGHVTVNRCLLTFRPATVSSAANFVPGRATANLAYGSSGDELCIDTSAPVDLMIDVVGYTTSRYGAPQLLSENLRLLETRDRGQFGPGTMDEKFDGIGRLPGGTEFKLDVAGRTAWWGAQVPKNISAAVLNITAVRPSANGHVVAYECGKKPSTSNLNMRPGGATPNATLVPVGADGTVCLYTSVDTDLVVDITGFVSSATTPVTARRIELSQDKPSARLEVVGGTAPYTLEGDLPPSIKLGLSETGEVSFTGDAAVFTHYVGPLSVVDANGLKAELAVIIAWYPPKADVDSGIVID